MFAKSFRTYVAALRAGLCAVVAVAAHAQAPQANSLSVVSWNLEHMMSVSGFERWRSFCEPFSFSDALAESKSVARPAGLTFCTAHMGTGWPPRKTAPKPGVSACPRDAVAVQSLPVHIERQAAMRALISSIAAQTDLFLFQEVIDDKAIAELFSAELARDFMVLSLHQVLPQNYPVAQLLGAAVRRSKFREVRQGAYEALAQRTADGHLLRPGQALDLTLVDGTRLSVLNVHLKAGCNQHDLQDPWGASRANDPDQPSRSCDPYAGVSRSSQRQQRVVACDALRRQLEPLEDWIDGKQNAPGLPHRHPHFLVAGDFNRRLHLELNPKAGPARLNDEPATAAYSDMSIRLVWPELNDGDPAASRMRLATRPSGDPQMSCKHQGIDHFMVSQALAGRQGEYLSRVSLVDVPSVTMTVPDAYGQSALRLSDHCPHRLTIHWKR